MDRVADAVIESGMRAAIAKSTMDMGNAITGAMKETADEAIENTKKLYQKYQELAMAVLISGLLSVR